MNPDIIRLRLRYQRITTPVRGTPRDIVQHLGAVQAQDYAGAKWSIGLRLRKTTDADIDRAFDTGDLLRTHLLRPTWHFVTPADVRWMLALTAPRVHAANAGRYRALELDAATFERGNAVLAEALHGGRHRTRDELRALLNDAGIPMDAEQRLAYLLMQAELNGLICSGPRKGRQFTYALLEERVPPAPALTRDEALAELTRRFFTSRGPATEHDFAKWSGLTVTDARHGLDMVAGELRRDTVDDRSYWRSRSTPRARETSPTVHLLSIYDEYISGYRDHQGADGGYGSRLVGLGNALQYIMVLDGRIVGTWKRTLTRTTVRIETAPFRRLTAAERDAVALAAEQYGAFLGLEVALDP